MAITSKTSSPIPTARPVRPAAPQPNPSISNKTLEVSQHTQAPKAKSLEVSQENAGVTAIQKIMGDNTLTVEEKREKLSKLPPSEERDKTIKGLPEAEIKHDKGLQEDKGKDDDDKFEPFREEDILKYMYEQWLIGGMNVICNYGYHKAEKLTRCISKGLADGLSTAWHDGFKEEWRNGNNNQQSTAGQTSQQTPPQTAAAQTDGAENTSPDALVKCVLINDEISKNWGKDIGTVLESALKDDEFLTRVKEEKATEEDKKRPLYKVFEKLPPEKRKQQVESFARFTENTFSMIDSTLQIARQMVLLKHTENALKSQNPQAMNRIAFERETALMAMIIGNQLSQSKNPEAFLEKLSDTLEKGQEHTRQNIQQGNYAINGKMPKENSYLADLYKQLDISENGKYSSSKFAQKTSEILKRKPQNLYEDVLHKFSSITDAKSHLKQGLEEMQQLTPPQRPNLTDNTKPTTMNEALTDSQTRNNIHQNTLQRFGEIESTIAERFAANEQRKDNALSRIAGMVARNGLSINPNDKSAENVTPLRPTNHQSGVPFSPMIGYTGR